MKMSMFYPLKITSVTAESIDSKIFECDIRKVESSFFKFIPGQYINVRVIIDNEEYIRSYSICSLPDGISIKFGVKSQEEGKVSNFLLDNLVKDSIIEVSRPYGHFWLQDEIYKSKDIVALVTGSGITPVFSMLKYFLKNSSKKNTFSLIYGNKTKVQTMFLDQLKDIEEKYNNVRLYFKYTQEKDESSERIGKDLINSILLQNNINIQDAYFLLCGKEEFITSSKNILQELIVPKERLKFEIFETSSLVDDGNEEVDKGSKGILEIDVEDKLYSFEYDETEKSILEIAAENGLELPYSCKKGICSTCVGQLVEGEIRMKKNLALTEEEVEEGYILCCQSILMGNYIKVRLDYL
jgi:ring-1,2-phenylacetyl-CoA epoxidase subunit PaaE